MRQRPVSLSRKTTVLHGHEIILRPARRGDFSAWSALRHASADSLRPFEPLWADDELSEKGFLRRLAAYRTEWRRGEGYGFFTFRRGDGLLVGGCHLSNVRRGVQQACTLGYWAGHALRGRGYTTDAVRVAAGFAFETLRLHRIQAACLPENTASRRVLEKAGFSEEGLARRYLRINGAWRDHVIYALIEDDPRPV